MHVYIVQWMILRRKHSIENDSLLSDTLVSHI